MTVAGGLSYRHLVERNPFELHVASDADFAEDLLVDTHCGYRNPPSID
jgi:hypothetical protein